MASSSEEDDEQGSGLESSVAEDEGQSTAKTEFYNDKEMGLITCSVGNTDDIDKMQAITVSVSTNVNYT